MNEIELQIPREMCFHIRLPSNVLELLENLDQDNPTLITAFDDQGRQLLIECIRIDDLITMKVVSGIMENKGETLSSAWSFSVNDLVSQLMENSTSSAILIGQTGADDFIASTVKDERRNDENDTSLIMGMVNDYMESVEVHELVPCAEEQLVEEIVFGNDCKVLAYSANELLINVGEDCVTDRISDNGYVQMQSSGIESFAEIQDTCERELLSIEKSEVAELKDQPKIVANLLMFRCNLCNSQFFKEGSGQRHLRRIHPLSSDAMLVTNVAKYAYICTTCGQPLYDRCHWRLHVKYVHTVFADHRPLAKVESFSRKLHTSWANRRDVPINCLLCHTEMHSPESYYLHIRRQHGSDPLYRMAMKHLLQIRDVRQRKKCRMRIQCFKCTEILTEYSVVSHLKVVHAGELNPTELIANAKLLIKKAMKTQNGMHQKSVHCWLCEKEVRIGTMKSHLEFHCPALIAVVPAGDINRELLESVTKRSADALLVRLPHMKTCSKCNKTMTLKSFYHHQRRVHGIGIGNAKTYSCSYCKKTFWDQYHLQNHLLVHTRDRAFVCLVCYRLFINLISYMEHHRKVHERQFQHTCSACGRGFWKRVNKVRHSCRPQDLSINQLKNARLTSKAKAVMEKWEGPFYVEMERTQAEKFISSRCESRVCLKQTNINDEKKLICKVCRKSFQSIRYFQSHFRFSHLQDYDLICEQCGLGFWNITQMTSHKCDASKRSFNEKKRHLLATRAKEMLRNMPKPYYYVLGVTGQLLNYPDLIKVDLSPSETENNFQSHQLVELKNSQEVDTALKPADGKHSGKNSFISADCEKSDEHAATRLTSIQPGYCLCSICGKEIKVKNYYPHMRRVHCDDSHKPITWKVCDKCGYRCQDNYKFRRHCLTHNKPAGISCELCGRVLYELVDYNQHFKRRHLGQFSIRCNDCGKGFWKMNALQAHICYPELKEENLRIQKLKEEAAIRKRDAVRGTTGINSDLGRGGALQNSSQKTKTYDNESIQSESTTQICDTEEKNNDNEETAHNSFKSETTASEIRNRTSQKLQKLPSTLKKRSNSTNNSNMPKASDLGVASCSLPDQKTSATIEEVDQSDVVFDSKSTENGTKGSVVNNVLTDSVSLKSGAKRQCCSQISDAVNSDVVKRKNCKKDQTEQSTDQIVTSGNVSHRYGTRKKQVFFRALLGKK